MFNIQITAIMKKINTLFLLLLGVLPMLAQEYSTKVVRIGLADEFLTSRPIDVTEEVSEVELTITCGSWNCFGGDLITQMSFTGYNPGGEVKRHVTITHSRGSGDVVFDGDVIILSGGTSDSPISLLSLELPQPLKALDVLDLRVRSTGDVSDTPVCFEGSGGTPVLTVTKQTEVVYYDGSVSAADGTSIAGAKVCIHRFNYDTGADDFAYSGTTDADGHYSVRVEESNCTYNMDVEADGYPLYRENEYFTVKEGALFYHPSWPVSLYNRLDFKAGQQATVFLPEKPDASWGRYYRFDRLEDGALIFEREEEPQDNVPYVIFPSRDFSIDVSSYDHAALAEADFTPFMEAHSSGKEYEFNGSYCSKDFQIGAMACRLFDSTPDCSDGKTNPGYPRVGAFRAYILAHGAIARYVSEARCVFAGEGTDGIEEHPASDCLSPGALHRLYDIQGRHLPGTPERGLYIRNGKKYLVK